MYGQNNGYFMPYQTPYFQGGAVPDALGQMKAPYTQAQAVQMPKPVTNDMLWVLNENEATSYPVAPNNSVVLWDKNKPTIYVKSVNAQGMPSIRILDFEERTDTHETEAKTHECKCGDKFVTIAEFNALKGKFYDLQARYDEMLLESRKNIEEKTKTTGKKTKGDDE